MYRTRLDLPLRSDATGRFLTWIIALMVYLAVLALAGAMALADMAGRWDQGLRGTLTVQIVPLTESAAVPPLAKRVEGALLLLRTAPGVERAEALPAEASTRLLEPWLGSQVALADLPMPALIDVVLARGATVDMPALAARLAEAIPGARLDDHAAWLSDLLALIRAVQGIAVGIVVLIGSAAVIAVIFAVRSGLAIHRGIVELLHVMGAPDDYVARQFQAHVLGLAVRGGIAGTVLAALTMGAIGWAAGNLKAGLLPDFALSPLQGLTLLLVPAVTAALAALTARWAVLRALAELP